MLFKYTKKEYLEKFFDTGEIRIGTLSDFRKIEKHNSAISDLREGKREFSRFFSGSSIVGSHSANINEITEMVFAPPGSALMILEDSTVTVDTLSPDLYVFCASASFNEKVMRQDFKCDSCFIIKNKTRFFREISNSLRESAYLIAQDNINYIGTKFDMDHRPESHIALTKDIEYSYQDEFRAVWKPRIEQYDLSPFNIIIPEGRKYCDIYIK